MAIVKSVVTAWNSSNRGVGLWSKSLKRLMKRSRNPGSVGMSLGTDMAAPTPQGHSRRHHPPQ